MPFAATELNPKVSIIIKTLNEENNINRCLKSAVNATKGISSEIILSDSLSTDLTIEIAKKYNIKIVQLKNPEDRCCGVGPQLGYQYAKGEYIYILDGDMELSNDFLRVALKKLENNPILAGVGGKVREMNQQNLEFKRRAKKGFKLGSVSRLGMGGLYRRKAIEEVGYFSHRGLHSFEELELGMRLKAKDWMLERINVPSVNHYGHTIESFKLPFKRLQTKFVYGYGELVRSSIGKPYFFKTLWNANIQFFVLLLWIVVIFLLYTNNPIIALTIPLLVYLVMALKKRSLKEGVLSLLNWHLELLGLICGFLRGLKNPNRTIESRLIK